MFNPLQWNGYRARQFRKEDDAFQQLVGDALKAQFFDHAFVAPTLGRDGSIDAWVSGTTATGKRFRNFAFPIIVECKHHDATSGNLTANISQGWEKVKKKLADQAALGWPEKFQPWKQAESYTYCISARFSSANDKSKLQESIRDFFGSIPTNTPPRLRRDQIRVWDWNDLAHWLRESGRITDDWLGIGFDELEDHGSYRDRIGRIGTGFHAYLLAEKLPFIAPYSHDPFHPDGLFKRLSNDESLVLVGEGGVGKTRTVFEVAAYAHRVGWRVLHLRPSEKGIDLRALTEELLRHSGHTLVTADYIDQFHDFDARYWTHTLLPEAKNRGVQLALLANARPLAASQILPRLTEQKLFSVVDMNPSSIQREQVTRQIEAVICPRAVQILGEARVRELCGSRAIIAMFIARELEHLAEGNCLAHDALPHPGDLTGWVLKRLREDKLISGVPASPWELSVPLPALFAVTAVLASCPMTEEELTGVATATLDALPGAISAQAIHIVTTLRQGGWLEEERYRLRTPHDAVADEILQNTLCKFPDALPVIFAGARQGRPLGRFAVSLGRLAGLGVACMPILSCASQWLKREATTLSEGLIHADPDATAYALGAVFDCPPLSVSALEAWSQLIAPWLESHTRHPAARHLLYRGLKQLPEQEAHRLRNASLEWLNSNSTAIEADFVLGPLLQWTSTALDGRESELLSLAMGWLRAHATETEAQFVLSPLLGKWTQERLGVEERNLLKLAMGWLRVHCTEIEAHFVLYSLLGKWTRERLGEEEGNLRKLAMDWLRKHATDAVAGFALDPLLRWTPERIVDEEGDLLQMAMGWLRVHLAENEAQFVLNSLLGWSIARLGEDESNLLHLAMVWLQSHSTKIESRFLLASLADHCLVDRPNEFKREILDRAMSWLRAHRNTLEAAFVLKPVLALTQNHLGKYEYELLQLTMDWLRAHSLEINAGFVLQSVLEWAQARMANEEEELLKLAMRWLRTHATESDAQFVITSLLEKWSQERLGKAEVELINTTKAWLELFGNTRSADFVFNGLLLKTTLTPNDRTKWCRHALQLAAERQSQGDETHLLKTLLQLAGRHAGEIPANEILIFAGGWLDRHPTHPERIMVLARLLRIAWLPNDSWKRTAQAALDCLESQVTSKSNDYALNGLVTRMQYLGEDERARWLALCVRWIEQEGSQRDSDSLLINCLKFYANGVPDDVIAALSAAYSRRFSGKAFNWNHHINSR